MNLHQQECIVAIGDYGNMNEAAAHLYITPTALNMQLLKLERELGQQLFVRTRRRLEPTLAGRVYLQGAREMLAIKQHTYARLNDIAEHYTGEYQIGLAYEHGADALLHAYPQFTSRYPQVTLRGHEGFVSWQMDALHNGILDLAFVLYGKLPDTDDTYIQLSEENLLLGMPIKHPLAHQASEPGEPLRTIDLTLLKGTPFALMQQNSTMRERLDPIFLEAGYWPNIIMESGVNRVLHNLAAQQVCCTIIPQSYATDQENLVWFALPTHPRFAFYAVHRKGTRLNRPMRELVELIRDYAQDHFQFPKV